MEKVTGYRSNSGKLFLTEAECIHADMESAIATILDKMNMAAMLTKKDLAMLISSMIELRVEIIEALNGTPDERPRDD